MRFFRWANEGEQRLHLGYVAVFIGVLTVVTILLSTRSRQSLTYQLISQSDIAGPASKSSELEISHKGRRFAQDDKRLTVVILRVVNDGNAPLNDAVFDADNPPGFTVMNAELIERPRVIPDGHSTADWNGATLKSSTYAVLDTMNLQPGESFDLQLLLLRRSQDTNSLAIVPTGLYGRGQEFAMHQSAVAAMTKPFWRQVSQGSLLVHLMRATCYVGLGLCCLILLVGVDHVCTRAGQDRLIKTRQRVIAEYRSESKGGFDSVSDAVLNEYLTHGIRRLEKLNNGLAVQNLAKMSRIQSRVSTTALLHAADESELDSAIQDYLKTLTIAEREMYSICQAMLELGVITKDGNVLSADDRWMEEMREFLAFLGGHRYYRGNRVPDVGRKAA